MRIQSALGEAANGSEDVVGSPGPDERFGVSIACVEVLLDGVLELLDRFEGAATDLLLRQVGEESFDLVQPRTVRWSEVHVKTGTFGQPAPNDRRLVSGVVVD